MTLPTYTISCRMTPDEVDQAMAELEDINIRNTGRFVLRVLNDLLSARRWLDVIQYLEKTVRRHAHQTVVPAPANAPPQDFVNIHGELFLYLHRQYVWELLANGNRVAAEQHFMKHVRPLAEYVPPGSRLRGLFNNLRANIIYDIRPRYVLFLHFQSLCSLICLSSFHDIYSSHALYVSFQGPKQSSSNNMH